MTGRVSWAATFPPEADAARRSRLGVRDALREAGVDREVIDGALVVVGELVSNAIRHARTEFGVSVDVDAATIRIEVFDRDTRPPSLLGLDDESTSGRGLHLVAGIARDWGWQTADEDGVSGKRVWAELGADPAPEPGDPAVP